MSTAKICGVYFDRLNLRVRQIKRSSPKFHITLNFKNRSKANAKFYRLKKTVSRIPQVYVIFTALKISLNRSVRNEVI